jgi:hypothetical protein
MLSRTASVPRTKRSTWALYRMLPEGGCSDRRMDPCRRHQRQGEVASGPFPWLSPSPEQADLVFDGGGDKAVTRARLQ